MASKEHIPVLASELIALLQLEPTHTVVDLTLGRSGHASLVMTKLNSDGCFVGIDADPGQIAYAESVLPKNSKRHLVTSNFAQITETLRALAIPCANSIYADLGLSTIQLLDHDRGFSFQSEVALDMRLNVNTQKIDAQSIINQWDEVSLANLFWEYGEERLSRPIAKAIVTHRKVQPIKTGKQLAEIIAQIKRGGGKKIHPATQVFQALRMYVNDELGTLRTMLQSILPLLCKNGRFVIITFHSIEDRLVKNVFKEWKQANTVEILTKKAIKATWTEMKQNPRARSARLRAIRKLT
ncbi:MAG: 16S rRNA (cytosine(1402)-N(4))-methyltransferase RsmH [Candidatus Abawacabacteria bacterium]|nr:16S rRNA (cytosine(1402)-N(4))-methyltransferase RsmH [Candidatus Abawacabacteria bacterium]